MLIILPYKNGSKSVQEIKKATVSLELKVEGSKFKGAANKKVINWGVSQVQEEVAKCQVLNLFGSVQRAANKLSSFEAFAAGETKEHIPFFTTKLEEAIKFLQEKEGRQIVERHKLNGHSGEGIRIVDHIVNLNAAPLYVEYVPKTQEYRVHVFQGKVIDVQRKARKKDVPDGDVNWKIRNLQGGFIYARDFAPEDLPIDMLEIASGAVRDLGLDFGAVDIVYNQKRQKPYVLEINTAPGLQGQTLEAYVKAFQDAGWDNPV